MSVTKKQRAYASRLGRDTARYEQDNQSALVEHPTGFTLYWLVFGYELGTDHANTPDEGIEADALLAEWNAGYRKQVELYESCNPHHFDSGRALSPTDLARCKRCHVSIMSGYLLPLETKE